MIQHQYTDLIPINHEYNKEVLEYTMKWLDKIYNKKRYTDIDAVKLQLVLEFGRRCILINNKKNYSTLFSAYVLYKKYNFKNKQDTIINGTIGRPNFKGLNDTALKYMGHLKDFVILFNIADYIENTVYLLMNEIRTGKNIWNFDIDFLSRFYSDEKAESLAIYNLKSELLKLYFIKVIFIELSKRFKFKYIPDLIDYKLKNILIYLKTYCADKIDILEKIFYKGITPYDLDNIDKLITDKDNNEKEFKKFIDNNFNKCDFNENISLVFYAFERL